MSDKPGDGPLLRQVPADPRFKGATPEALALALRKPKKAKEQPAEKEENVSEWI